MSSPNSQSTPSRRISINKTREPDGELSQSLGQLSLSISPSAAHPLPARSPRSPNPTPGRPSSSYRPAVDRSPSALSMRASSHSSFNGASSNGRESRAGTPTLLRKASMNSLHSANGAGTARRSSSANIMPPTPSKATASPDPPRPPPPTANAIARTHFRGELELLHSEESNRNADTLVVLHDSCYGHRFSRPRTSRAALNTIVERPERIKACVLGVAAAYVLLGERHADGVHAPHPSLNPATIPSIPFRIQKSTRRVPLLSPAVTNVHGTKWMEELKIMCDSAEAKLATGGKELQRPEMNRGPDDEEPKKFHEGDLYLCSESLEALEGSLGAVCDAVDAVFKDDGPKRAFVAVRPPGHHCSASYPSGFCWINNVHVGIMHAILGHGLTHAAIIDIDLHHGDGSQQVAWQHNSRGVGLNKNAAYWKKTSIGYFSLHDINSYPCEMGDEEKVKNASLCIENAHGQHVWNVHLEPWETEAEFWKLYENRYSVLLEKARRFLRAQTDRLRSANQTSKAAIFLSAGFDASEWEGAGMQRHSVNVPTGFYARIAQDVAKIAEEEGTSVHGRLISVLEGGYSNRALTSGVLSHISGLAGSDPALTGPQTELDSDIMGSTGSVGDRRNSLELKMRPHPYDHSWWNSEELERLESGVVASPPPPRVSRNITPGNYSSPTHSSTAKMVDSARLRRQASMNGLLPPRPPTPPPPEVPWNVAAHGLCAVLVPTDRATTSCRPEDLSAEATRIRRDRQMALEGILPEEDDKSTPVPPPPAPSRMSLRERKPTNYFQGEDDLGKNRRRTVAGTSVLASEKGGSRSNTPQPGRAHTRQGRRLSAASTITESLDGESVFSDSMSERPMTSMTERPETSMSVRTTTGGPLAVKKTRTANANKKGAPKAPRAKNPAAIAPKSGSRPSSPIRAPKASQNPADKAGDDLDKITSGIKKITLLTKQQKEARARGESAVSSPARVAPEDAKDTPLPSSTPDSLQQQPSSPQETMSQASLPQEIPLPAGNENTTMGPPPSAPSSATPDLFIPYQPEGPTPTIISSQEPLKWLPPNTSTPSPIKQKADRAMVTPSPTKQGFPTMLTPSPVKQADLAGMASPSLMRRADLPTFTATSQIPFAPRTPSAQTPAAKSPTAKSESIQDEAIWEVPETPE
ncbi:Histone deacetylase HOS3 [Cytospora mali]|uniref:Histone deacetylase HOS3 n=1 Tax=Cytospora mali TaxID=578113 RepID=A0A194UTX0_CYTMA|nr:Histone deacetylase HOS3 [Valsa mali var. pyri (nom. inval.)]